MISRLNFFFTVLGLFVWAHTTVQAQEPTVGGLDITLVQLPTPDDPTLLLDVGPWLDAGCGAATLIGSGGFDLDIGETSDTLRWGWWECRLIDPDGVEHCQRAPWSQPRQIDLLVGRFGWFQGLYGGAPIYGESFTTHRIDFEARDMTPRRVTIRGYYAMLYVCDGSDVMEPDEYARSEVSFFIGCRADLDGDDELTLFDFLAFQNAFSAGDSIADFDGDGELTIFDFLAFQNEFDAGCE